MPYFLPLFIPECSHGDFGGSKINFKEPIQGDTRLNHTNELRYPFSYYVAYVLENNES